LKKELYVDSSTMTTTLPTADTTTTTFVTTTYYFEITTKPEITLKGDANLDGEMNMADAVLIMQSLANPNKYGINGTDDTHITAQGEKNGDMDGNGLTNADALEIQKRILKIEDDFDNAITTDFIVTEIEDNTILVKPTDSIGDSNIYRVSTSVIADGSTPKVNSVYKVTWNGETLETYPAQFGKIYDMRLA
ncbi:MAG: dockerin type I repeat-containing protein, partial [Ruminococcus sp.]|nr:dockerin type I repeat-containing protein [Ruminococcus sp.]